MQENYGVFVGWQVHKNAILGVGFGVRDTPCGQEPVSYIDTEVAEIYNQTLWIFRNCILLQNWHI